MKKEDITIRSSLNLMRETKGIPTAVKDKFTKLL
jgi:hypothetical protein